MEEQKDTSKKALKNKLSGQSLLTVSNYYEVQDQEQYLQLAHRSQKIVTALYMITDFLSSDDPLRRLVRQEITTVMQDLFSAVHLSKIERVELLSGSHNRLYSVISYFNVIHENGFVSEMNHSIVSHEMVLLCLDIDIQIKKSLPYYKKENNTRAVKEFSFADSFFKKTEVNTREEQKDINDVKDVSNKIEEEVSFKEEKEKISSKTKILVKKNNQKDSQAKRNGVKNDRQENVLKILRQKKDARINDICSLIKGCSSKTIQRDLADLIKAGLVKKEGDRRWSVYNLNY